MKPRRSLPNECWMSGEGWDIWTSNEFPRGGMTILITILITIFTRQRSFNSHACRCGTEVEAVIESPPSQLLCGRVSRQVLRNRTGVGACGRARWDFEVVGWVPGGIGLVPHWSLSQNSPYYCVWTVISASRRSGIPRSPPQFPTLFMSSRFTCKAPHARG